MDSWTSLHDWELFLPPPSPALWLLCTYQRANIFSAPYEADYICWNKLQCWFNSKGNTYGTLMLLFHNEAHESQSSWIPTMYTPDYSPLWCLQWEVLIKSVWDKSRFFFLMKWNYVQNFKTLNVKILQLCLGNLRNS